MNHELSGAVYIINELQTKLPGHMPQTGVYVNEFK